MLTIESVVEINLHKKKEFNFTNSYLRLDWLMYEI